MEKYGLIENVDYEYKDFSTSAGIVRHWLDEDYGDIDVDKVIKSAKNKKVSGHISTCLLKFLRV